jgi:hypothetical protein
VKKGAGRVAAGQTPCHAESSVLCMTAQVGGRFCKPFTGVTSPKQSACYSRRTAFAEFREGEKRGSGVEYVRFP